MARVKRDEKGKPIREWTKLYLDDCSNDGYLELSITARGYLLDMIYAYALSRALPDGYDLKTGALYRQYVDNEDYADAVGFFKAAVRQRQDDSYEEWHCKLSKANKAAASGVATDADDAETDDDAVTDQPVGPISHPADDPDVLPGQMTVDSYLATQGGNSEEPAEKAETEGSASEKPRKKTTKKAATKKTAKSKEMTAEELEIKKRNDDGRKKYFSAWDYYDPNDTKSETRVWLIRKDKDGRNDLLEELADIDMDDLRSAIDRYKGDKGDYCVGARRFFGEKIYRNYLPDARDNSVSGGAGTNSDNNDIHFAWDEALAEEVYEV